MSTDVGIHTPVLEQLNKKGFNWFPRPSDELQSPWLASSHKPFINPLTFPCSCVKASLSNIFFSKRSKLSERISIEVALLPNIFVCSIIGQMLVRPRSRTGVWLNNVLLCRSSTLSVRLFVCLLRNRSGWLNDWRRESERFVIDNNFYTCCFTGAVRVPEANLAWSCSWWWCKQCQPEVCRHKYGEGEPQLSIHTLHRSFGEQAKQHKKTLLVCG